MQLRYKRYHSFQSSCDPTVSYCIIWEGYVADTCDKLQQLHMLFLPLISKIHNMLLLFMLIGWEYVSELQPPMGLLFIPQMIYEYGALVEWYWQGKTK
jgi:hypothetical protein